MSSPEFMPMSKGDSTSTGQIIDNPLSLLPAGVTIKFNFKLFPPFSFAGLRFVQNREVFDGALLGMLFRRGEVYQTLGSAAMVAPGVALTALHVIQTDLESFLSDGCLIYGSTKSNLMLWRARSVTLLDDSDLAIVTLEARSMMPAGGKLIQFRPTTRIPKQGESVLVCGVHPAREHFEKVGNRFEIPGGTYAATGKVLDVYLAGRDRATLPGPCFSFECETVGAMSGGPVIDQFGHLVGLLSTGINGGVGVSFASLVGPALNEKITPDWPPGFHAPQVSLSEIQGLCVGEDFGHPGQ